MFDETAAAQRDLPYLRLWAQKAGPALFLSAPGYQAPLDHLGILDAVNHLQFSAAALAFRYLNLAERIKAAGLHHPIAAVREGPQGVDKRPLPATRNFFG
jgi:hypothetical protein